MQVYGPAPVGAAHADRFVYRGRTPFRRVCRRLAGRGIFASHGDFYATTAVERLGQSGRGLVRIGCACYTTEEEIDRLLAAVRAIAIVSFHRD